MSETPPKPPRVLNNLREAPPPSPPAQRLEASVVAALVAEHGEDLRRFVQGVLRDAAMTADVLQTTFTKLLERGEESDTQTRKAWLFKVAFNEAMSLRRRQAIGNKVLERVAWQQAQATASSSADASLLQTEQIENIKHLLNQLPIDQRTIVRMRIYEEKTFAAIASELNIPLGTALGRMRIALQKLRTLLEIN